MYIDPQEKVLFLKALDKGLVLFNQGSFEEAYDIWFARWEEEALFCFFHDRVAQNV